MLTIEEILFHFAYELATTAIQKDEFHVLAELLKDKPDLVNKTNLRRHNLLHEAIFYKNEESAKFLIEKGININLYDYYNETPIMRSTDIGVDSITETLVSKGALLNIINGKGQSALTMALNKGNFNIVKTLLKAGASFSREYYFNDDTRKYYHENDLIMKHCSYVSLSSLNDLSQNLDKNFAEVLNLLNDLKDLSNIEQEKYLLFSAIYKSNLIFEINKLHFADQFEINKFNENFVNKIKYLIKNFYEQKNENPSGDKYQITEEFVNAEFKSLVDESKFASDSALVTNSINDDSSVIVDCYNILLYGINNEENNLRQKFGKDILKKFEHHSYIDKSEELSINNIGKFNSLIEDLDLIEIAANKEIGLQSVGSPKLKLSLLNYILYSKNNEASSENIGEFLREHKIELASAEGSINNNSNNNLYFEYLNEMLQKHKASVALLNNVRLLSNAIISEEFFNGEHEIFSEFNNDKPIEYNINDSAEGSNQINNNDSQAEASKNDETYLDATMVANNEIIDSNGSNNNLNNETELLAEISDIPSLDT